MTITALRDDKAATRHLLKIRHHSLSADAPAAFGGKDEGPSPHDFYDAALAACKALTVLLYARRKGMPLEDLEVLMARDDSQERQGIYKLKASLRLVGPLDEAQRAELLAAADKCSVHRLMSEVQTEIRTVLL